MSNTYPDYNAAQAKMRCAEVQARYPGATIAMSDFGYTAHLVLGDHAIIICKAADNIGPRVFRTVDEVVAAVERVYNSAGSFE